MPSLLAIDWERTEVFFALHNDLLRHCAARGWHQCAWKTVEGKRLLAAARTFFGYSSTTVDMDIMRTLLKHFNPQTLNVR